MSDRRGRRGLVRKHQARHQKVRFDNHYQPETYRQWARAVKMRDRHICDYCKESKRNITRSGLSLEFHAHHLYDKSTYPDLELIMTNGITLCAVCHDNFHYKFMGGVQVSCTPMDYQKYKLEIDDFLGRHGY